VDAALAGGAITRRCRQLRELVTVNNRSPSTAPAPASMRAMHLAMRQGSIVRPGCRRWQPLDVVPGQADNVTIDGSVVQAIPARTSSAPASCWPRTLSGSQILNNVIRHNVAGLYLASASVRRERHPS